MTRVLWLLLLLVPGAASANGAEAARAAMAQLDAANTQLEEATGARDRVAALTQTVKAFEQGLAAIRGGLRTALQQEEELTRRLVAKEAEVAGLIGVLQVMGQSPEQQMLLHPGGPMGTARSGMILTEITPVLQAEVARLRADLEEVENLRILQQDAAARLRAGLTEVQEARATLAQAIADRTPLPKRFTADPVQTAVLIGAAETLDAFASGLGDIAIDEITLQLPTARRLMGTLKDPARGTLLRAFDEPDAAGVNRPGIILATRPRALVTSPAAATVRYQGPLLDYGNVMILEPAQELLVVLAGLSEVYVLTGDVVQTGAPLGLM
ncbi:MAG: peptidoglycan DD-metalloendopeptidase family protein, partial [Pseudomonadota bacterium]